MFILYALIAGLLAGWILGGRLEALERLRLRWVWIAIAGLAVQVVLFSPLVPDDVATAVGPAVYVASTLAVLAFVLRNVRVAGLPIVAAGAISNLAAILANGGTMPASREALESIGRAGATGYANSRAVASPALAPLGDVFALPSWVPFANVFSVGDVLIGAGVAVLIAAGMRSGDGAESTAGTPPERPGTGERGIPD